MATQIRDLWPSDIPASAITPPIAILREQAQLLSKKTHGLLLGEIASTTVRGPMSRPLEGSGAEMLGQALRTAYGLNMLHTFHIVAPALDNYRYALLSVRHDYYLYPAVLSFHPTGQDITANSEDEFQEQLAALLAHEETMRVLGSLLAQVRQ